MHKLETLGCFSLNCYIPQSAYVTELHAEMLPDKRVRSP